MTRKATILLVEDNEDDIFLMQRAINGAGISNPLHIVQSGQAAIDYLSGTSDFANRTQHPLPSIVFLDLKLPLVMGLDVLRWIRNQDGLDDVVVVVLTSSNEPSDIKQAYGLGANSYVVKPPTPSQLLDLARAFNGTGWNLTALHRSPVNG